MSRMRAGSAAAVVAFALSHELTMTEIQEATGISCGELMNPEAKVPEHVMPNLWTLLGERFPNEPLTLQMARTAPLSFFGGLADGAQFADDLRAALGLLTKNRKIIAERLDVQLHEHPSRVEVVSRHPLDHVDKGRSAELGIALAARLLREFLGIEDCILCVTLSHSPTCPEEHYAEYFGVPVEFGAPDSALVLKPEKMATRIRYSNVELFRYVEIHFAGVRKQQEGVEELRELTSLRKAAAENALRGEFGAAAVAAAINMSLRSAQRLTAEHGQTLQGLIEQVREDRAKEFLSDANLDVVSIALLLGYSDDRAFRRAFQRWTGQTPSEYRDGLRSRQN